MKSSIFKVALVVVLAFATTFAIAQATAPDQSQQAPGQSSPQSQQYPPSDTQSTGQSQSSAASSSNDVQTKIQTAFRQDPTLANSGISVSVTDDKVELSGTATSKDEKDKAKSIAESNAGGRQVMDNVKVGGGESSTPPPAPPQ